MSENILLAYGNKATGATLSGGQWESLLPLTNLKDGRLGKVARSDDATVYDTRFRFDLGANYVLRALALVNHNLTTAARWRVKVGTSPLDVDYTAADDPRDERVSYSGAANRTRVNSAGLIVSKTAPRIDYDPVTLASDGLLVEEGRENLLLRSNALDTSPWSSPGSNVTVSSDGTLFRGLTFWKLAKANTTSSANLSQTVAISATAGGYALTIALLAGNSTQVGFGLLGGVSSWGANTASIRSGPGTVSTASGYTTVSGLSTTTPTVVELVKTATAGESITLFLYPGTPSSTTSGAYNYFCPMNVEIGSFSTSYIPTTSAAVTATADVATITGSNFSGAHSATAGTLYAEFDVITTVAGTRPILSMDDNTANERFELYASGTDLKFKVVDGGSTVVDMTIGTIAANTFYKVAVAWAANDFAASLSGAAVVTDTSGTLPTVDRMRIGANQAGDYLNGHVRRFARWLTRRTNAELQSLATTGPDALGYDTGWLDALQMTFHGDTPANWGEQYPLIATFDPTTVRYGTVEIEDTANGDGYVELGQLFVAGGFTTETNPTSLSDGRMDLSSSVKSVGGQKYSTARRRPRKVDLGYAVLTEEEGERMDEMMAEIGTTEDVLYVPDPADPAHTQRWGFLGTLQELSPLEYPLFEHRATAVRIEQKL